ncbi:MAG TPA: hypothetical protein VLB47_09150, partial [Solirubrobacteraceae bacterium]|nr:hypothetical protein [Solirubrobacteraceae bacterium]
VRLLVLGGLQDDAAAAGAAVDRALGSGAAAERFARMVAALDGPTDLLERPAAHLPVAPVAAAVAPDRAGFVTAIDARALGLAVVALGGGRRRETHAVDPAVGLDEVAALGAEVAPGGRPLAIVHARDADAAAAAAAAVRAAMTVGPGAPPPAPVVTEELP